jgi:cytochrome c peroxidase
MKAVNRMLAVGAAASLALAGAAQAVDPGAPLRVAQAKNPCAAKNPCGAKNPCAAAGKVDPKLISRPAGTKLMAGNAAELVKEGERLWNDKKLSSNGLACNTCHVNNANFKPTFAKPFPHTVAMVQEKAGLKQIKLDEMIQICMLVPMAS